MSMMEVYSGLYSADCIIDQRVLDDVGIGDIDFLIVEIFSWLSRILSDYIMRCHLVLP